MVLKPRKGQFFITEVVFILGLLFVFAVVFVVFVIPFMFTGTAGISAQFCYSSITMKANAEDAIEGAVDGAHVRDHEDDDWYFGKYTEKTADWLGGTTTKDLNDAVEGFGEDMIDALPDMCHTNEISCIGSADWVAECMYDRAAQTWYALRGGKSHTQTNFNMFRVQTVVTSPGMIMLEGPCATYVGLGDSGEVNVKREEDGLYLYAKQTTSLLSGETNCTLTFNYLDEAIMNLVQVSKCQNAPNGPYDKSCKCFYNTGQGYRVGNGIPNIAVNRVKPWVSRAFGRGGDATITYSVSIDYIGCGISVPSAAEMTRDFLSGISSVGATENMIMWETPTVLTTPHDARNDTVVFYTRIPGADVTGVVMPHGVAWSEDSGAPYVIITTDEGGLSN